MTNDEKKKSAKILAIVNQKGGVGKSTTAINLAATLGELNKSVLLIDLDPQGNTSSGLGFMQEDLETDIYDTLIDGAKIQKTYLETPAKNVTLVPASIALAGAEIELIKKKNREKILKKALQYQKKKFDYILIDCPPSLGLLTLNGLVAAEAMLIPVQAEYYALEGVGKLLETQEMIKKKLNPQLDIFGLLITMYDRRTRLSRDVNRELRGYFKEKVFKVVIPRSVRLAEAPSHGVPITQYSWTNKGASAYRKMAKEVINRD